MKRLIITPPLIERISRLEPETRNLVLGHIFDLRVNGLRPDVSCETEAIRLIWPDILREYARLDKDADRQRTVRGQSRIEKETNNEEGKIPHTPLKEEETKKEKELSLQRVRVRGVFVPPAAEEVATYCRERRNSVDPQAFVAFYESNGWKVGRNAMKDWHAAVRTWERRESRAPRQSQFVAPTRHADNWRGTRKEDIGDVLG